MAEFSPTQLDALEDALEDLELAGVPAELEADGRVTDRLGDYRDLLALSREALPLEEVPAGVLASVLAEAAESPSAVPAAPAEPTEAAPWWKRIRTWIPVLAVGASAALVLIMMRGADSSQDEAAVVASAKSSQEAAESAAKDSAPPREGRLLEAEPALQAAAANDPAEGGGAMLGQRGRLRGDGVVGGLVDGAIDGAPGFAAEADEAPAPVEEEEAEEAADGDREAAKHESAEAKRDAKEAPRVTEKLPYDASPGDDAAPAPRAEPSTPAPAKDKKKSAPSKSGGASKGGGSSPAKPPAAAPKPGPKTKRPSSAAQLSAADTKRRKGRCAEAKPVYASLTDDSDRSTRARALAGLGLCALRAGNDDAASDYFARAKALDKSVASFIERERTDTSPSEEPVPQQSL